MQAVMLREMAAKYPHAMEMAIAVSHDGDSIVGSGCHDQFEFEFALDLLLGGFERLRHQGWTSTKGAQGRVSTCPRPQKTVAPPQSPSHPRSPISPQAPGPFAPPPPQTPRPQTPMGSSAAG